MIQPPEEGWSVLQFYAHVVRTFGIPARFHRDGENWIADAPFHRPVPQSILDMLEANGV